MKHITITMWIASLAIVMLTTPVWAQTATIDDALRVAANWLDVVLYNKGAWGNSDVAYIDDIQEFWRGQRVIGYFCKVKPQGFIIVSMRKELAPVKAYSSTCDLDPASEQGLADVIKRGMEGVLVKVEEKVGPLELASSQQIQNVLEINYRSAWKGLEVDLKTFEEKLTSGGMVMNYQEGDELLLTSWHQGDPYNTQCPPGNTGCAVCNPLGDSYQPTLPTLVGCVATAGSQIMKYWNWPPYGVGNHFYIWDGDDSCGGSVGGGLLSCMLSDTYDWPHIANRYVWDVGQNRWEDENGNPLTQTHLDAVAELCYEVAVAVDMDFGVCFSGAITSDMEGVYENHYRYSTACGKLDRVLFPSVGWYNLMKIQFTLNRPIQYRIKGHSIVADGWEEEEIDGTLTRRYHMNYGWDNSRNTWYTLDALYQPDPDGDTDDEYMLINIYPAQALGSSLSGAYLCNASFPYRYFDQDATGSSAVFTQGQYLQFLPKITVTCTSTTGGNISFIGTSSNNTRLFTRGDTSKGIKITNGALKLYQGGSIKFE